MARPTSKHRAKEMKRLGWVWSAATRSWLFISANNQFLFDIEYSQAQKKWLAERYGDGNPVAFDCPIAAAVWISVEYADEIAADKERTRRGREEYDSGGFSLPA